jgi:hypothetical protein
MALFLKKLPKMLPNPFCQSYYLTVSVKKESENLGHLCQEWPKVNIRPIDENLPNLEPIL